MPVLIKNCIETLSGSMERHIIYGDGSLIDFQGIVSMDGWMVIEVKKKR